MGAGERWSRAQRVALALVALVVLAGCGLVALEGPWLRGDQAVDVQVNCNRVVTVKPRGSAQLHNDWESDRLVLDEVPNPTGQGPLEPGVLHRTSRRRATVDVPRLGLTIAVHPASRLVLVDCAIA